MLAESSTPAPSLTCSKCKRTDPPCGFHRNRAHRTGFDNWCRDCRSERNALNRDTLRVKNHERYIAKRDERLAKQAAYYWANRDKRLEYERVRRDEHADRLREAARGYREKRPEVYRERSRRYHAENRDRLNARTRTIHAKVRAERRIWWKHLVAGIRCENCGAGGRLHFHHVDPSTKYDSVTNMLKAPMKTIVAEMKKCRVLCCSCHRKEHVRLRKAKENGGIL